MDKILKDPTKFCKKIHIISKPRYSLFDDTIKKNVSYANPDATQEEIEMACNLLLQMNL